MEDHLLKMKDNLLKMEDCLLKLKEMKNLIQIFSNEEPFELLSDEEQFKLLSNEEQFKLLSDEEQFKLYSDEELFKLLEYAFKNNWSVEKIILILVNSKTEIYEKDNDEDEDEEYYSVLNYENENGMLLLHLAIKNNCCDDIIRMLIEKFPNAIDDQDNDGLTPLHHLLKNNNKSIEIINFILDNSNTEENPLFPDERYQSVLNRKDKDGLTPLHYCVIYKCSDDISNILVEKYPNAFLEKDNNGLTIFHHDILYNKSNIITKHICYSLELGDPEHIRLLRQCGDNQGKTYLHYVIEYNLSIQSIYDILNDCLNLVDIKDNNNLLPLAYAINNNSSQEIRDLLIAHTGLDYSGNNLFLINALKNKESDDKIISLINKESVRTFDQIGGETFGTPLLCALENGYSLDIIKRLVDEFPQSIMGIRQYFCSDNACHTALYANYSNDILSFILDKYPILCSIEDDEGHLPIDIAFDDTVNSSLENIKLLLENIHHPIKDGNHFLHNARNNTLEIFEFVLNKYPDSVKYKKESDTLPIHRISIRDANILKKIKLLLKKYPEGPKEKDIHGRLPIEIYARDYRYYEMGNNPNLQQILSYKYKVLSCLYEANPSEEARNCLTVVELKICDKIRQGAAMVAIESIKQPQPHVNEKILRKNANMFDHIKLFI